MNEPAAIAETHISVVAFVGDRAYKLKKPVRTEFLDFSTRELRERACHREVELNRRLAPDVYLGVADVRMGEELVDHLVVMRRMPSHRRLSRLLGEPGIDSAVRQIARDIAAFHERADRSPDIDHAAARDALLARWEASASDLERFTSEPDPVLDAGEVERVRRLAEHYLQGRLELFNERIRDGRVCDGHGDLQADDIFVLADGPRILDCIEFSDQYRWGDVLADVAFLAMDLERLDHPDLARTFLDQYRELRGDFWPASLEHHHIAYRAQVRAKVACLRVEQGDLDAATEARTLHALASRHLEQGAVRLVLVGGLPGTGKSTVARALGETLNAVVLSTDELRKTLAGIPLDQRASAAPHEGLYTPDRVHEVYAELIREAGVLLARGESVVLDASWTATNEREAAREVAATTTADLYELCCIAPMELAAARLRQRAAQGGDASDADPTVARALAAKTDQWPEAQEIDTSRSVAACVAEATAKVSGPRHDPNRGPTSDLPPPRPAHP